MLDVAHHRMAGLNSISPAPDFGPELSLTAFSAEINTFTATLDRYNQMLSGIDEVQNQVDAGEARLRDLNKRLLAAVAAHYGADSNQYEQAGGKRVRDRKRITRRAPEKASGGGTDLGGANQKT